ncbi:hypothetical protein [Sphingosinicella sp. BN140058]|uniref:hypothetical protein n=1 Tax=Sphingosinicella sp. BN140058 TaxID=1892855 RepID=UPI001010B3CC|nr:hypothetical protein [Sphingosinicella sp. BN140058]QAY79007.1 hypothetical protein ETR14_22565 [Sphingosinicella sp. BN140058]
MKRARPFFLLALGGMLAATSSPGVAQRLGTRIGRDAEQKDGPVIIRQIADCVVARQPAFVRSWLGMLPGTAAERELITDMTEDMSTCLDSPALVMDGKQIGFKPRTLRRPVALALVRKEVKTADQQAPAKDLSPWFAAAVAALPAGEKLDTTSIALQDFGHCIATSAWADTVALLASEPDSPAERGAIARLKPALGPCLTADVKLSLTIPTIREVVAEPVHHILSDAPALAVATQR